MEVKKFVNCWEFMKCGREIAGEKAAELGVCPAYPHHGRICAHIAGTLGGSGNTAVCAKNISDCKDCEFYKSQNYDQSISKLLGEQ